MVQGLPLHLTWAKLALVLPWWRPVCLLCACVHLRAYYLGRDHLITVGEQPQTSEKSAQLVSVHISWGGAPVSSASA